MKLPKHIPQFDFLRGVAVLAVMIYHVQKNMPSFHFEKYTHYGMVGVDLFFVLSGFLITGILLRTRGRPGYLKNFYAKRALRIWPVYYLLLAFILIALPLSSPAMRTLIFENCRPWPSALLFFQNILMKSNGNFGPMTVTWSLCVEEQFYLVWPFLVLVCPERVLKILAVCAMVISLTLRILAAHNIGVTEPYYNTLTRMDGLAVGALLAMYLPVWEQASVRRYAAWVLPAAIIIAFVTPHAVFFSMTAIAFGAVLCLSLQNEWMTRRRLIGAVGKISYCLYLVHVPIMDVLREDRFRSYLNLAQHPMVAELTIAGLTFAASIALATVSWFVLESRVLKFRKYFETKDSSGVKSASHVGQQLAPADVARAYQM